MYCSFLTECRIKAEGMPKFCEALKKNETLTALDLNSEGVIQAGGYK